MEMTKEQYKKYYNFKPFLTPTTLKIIAILCLTISQIVLVAFLIVIIPTPEELLKCADDQDELLNLFSSTLALIKNKDAILNVLKFGKVVAPTLIITLFSTLTLREDKFKRLFLTYLIGSILIYIVLVVSYNVLLIRIMDTIIKQTSLPDVIDNALLEYIETAGKEMIGIYLQVNIFSDLLIATIFYYFVMLNPKTKYFKNHKKLFRSCSLIPVLILIASSTLGILHKNRVVILPIYVLAILPYKGNGCHILFIIMVLFTKFRKKLYERKPREISYSIYSKTNKYIFNFSILITVVVLVFGTGDYILYKIATTFDIQFLKNMQFGKNIYYVILAPFLLLYNYKSKFRFKYLKIFIYLYYAALFAILTLGYLVVLFLMLDAIELFAQIALAIKEAASKAQNSPPEAVKLLINSMNLFVYNNQILLF